MATKKATPKKKKKTAQVKIKDISKQTPKVIANRIENVGHGIVKDINKKKDPTFQTQQRGRSNVQFNAKKGILQLGDKITSRNFLNIGHARKFMQTMLVSAKTHDYLKENKTAAIREIYYELKHTIAGTKESGLR